MDLFLTKESFRNQLAVRRVILYFFAGLLLIGALLPNLKISAQEGDVLDYLPAIIAAVPSSISIENGWFVKDGKAVWGNCQHNGWWRKNRASIVRKSSTIGPNRQEDIPLLVENMKQFGYPCFEHTLPLWHDRRRDAHDSNCRRNDNIVGPTLEFPWARSTIGTGCDGGRLFDLTKFDPWYFGRIAEMASEAEKQGVVFVVNLYLQHSLLEINAHYADFPWRPGNSIQNTGMPSSIPAANDFYQVRRDLHRMHIRKMLDTISPYPGTILSLSGEYTGSLGFMRFFLDEVRLWEQQNDADIKVSVGGTKDILDTILRDSVRSAQADVIDLRYFWYESNGRLFAPRGGREVPGRYALGTDIRLTSASQIYRQVKTYRDRYPEKAILHHIEASRDQTIAFLMAGGSALIRKLEYAVDSPSSYQAPPDSVIIQPIYEFMSESFASELVDMKPQNIITQTNTTTWAMRSIDGAPLKYLVYSKSGSFQISLRAGNYQVEKYSSSTGAKINTFNVSGGNASINNNGAGSGFFVFTPN